LPRLQKDIQKRQEAIDILKKFVTDPDDRAGSDMLFPYIAALLKRDLDARVQLNSLQEALGVETIARGVGRLSSRIGGDVARGAAGLFQDQAFLGGKLPGAAERIALDLFGADGMQLFEAAKGVLNGAKPAEQQQQQIERSLQATESRFLTRGRGQLSMGDQKLLEEAKQHRRILERMAKAFEELGKGNLLLVEGID